MSRSCPPDLHVAVVGDVGEPRLLPGEGLVEVVLGLGDGQDREYLHVDVPGNINITLT